MPPTTLRGARSAPRIHQAGTTKLRALRTRYHALTFWNRGPKSCFNLISRAWTAHGAATSRLGGRSKGGESVFILPPRARTPGQPAIGETRFYFIFPSPDPPIFGPFHFPFALRAQKPRVRQRVFDFF